MKITKFRNNLARKIEKLVKEQKEQEFIENFNLRRN